MLLDPLEEEFYLPPAFVELCDGERRQGKVVGQKHQSSVLRGIEETDTPELLRIILLCIEAVEGDNLVALQARCFVDVLGIQPVELEVALGSGYKEG